MMRKPTLENMTKEELIALIHELSPGIMINANRLQFDIAWVMYQTKTANIAQRMKNHPSLPGDHDLAKIRKNMQAWDALMRESAEQDAFYNTYIRSSK